MNTLRKHFHLHSVFCSLIRQCFLLDTVLSYIANYKQAKMNKKSKEFSISINAQAFHPYKLNIKKYFSINSKSLTVVDVF